MFASSTQNSFHAKFLTPSYVDRNKCNVTQSTPSKISYFTILLRFQLVWTVQRALVKGFGHSESSFPDIPEHLGNMSRRYLVLNAMRANITNIPRGMFVTWWCHKQQTLMVDMCCLGVPSLIALVRGTPYLKYSREFSQHLQTWKKVVLNNDIGLCMHRHKPLLQSGPTTCCPRQVKSRMPQTQKN